MIKPGEIVAVEGVESWTLAERRIWNQLLVNAWSDRISRTQRRCSSIPLSMSYVACHESKRPTPGQPAETAKHSSFPSRSSERQDDANCPNAGRNRSLTECTTARRAELEYDIRASMLVPLLRDSEIYARMEMKVLSAFTSKYALSLYEALAVHGLTCARQMETIGTSPHLRQLARCCAGRKTVPSGRTFSRYRHGACRAGGERLLADRRRDRAGQTRPQGHCGEDLMVEEAGPSAPPSRWPHARSTATAPAGRPGPRVRSSRPSTAAAGPSRAYPSFPPDCCSAPATRYRRRPACASTSTRPTPTGSSWVAGMKEPIRSPAGHFVDFCKRRAKELK